MLSALPKHLSLSCCQSRPPTPSLCFDLARHLIYMYICNVYETETLTPLTLSRMALRSMYSPSYCTPVTHSTAVNYHNTTINKRTKQTDTNGLRAKAWKGGKEKDGVMQERGHSRRGGGSGSSNTGHENEGKIEKGAHICSSRSMGHSARRSALLTDENEMTARKEEDMLHHPTPE